MAAPGREDEREGEDQSAADHEEDGQPACDRLSSAAGRRCAASEYVTAPQKPRAHCSPDQHHDPPDDVLRPANDEQRADRGEGHTEDHESNQRRVAETECARHLGTGSTTRSARAPIAPATVTEPADDRERPRQATDRIARPRATRRRVGSGLIDVRTVSRRSVVTVSMSTSSRSRSANAAVVDRRRSAPGRSAGRRSPGPVGGAVGTTPPRQASTARPRSSRLR